jgi:signal transduction histidine kinase
VTGSSVFIVLGAGTAACLGVAWQRLGQDGRTRASRGRLGGLGWCAALAAVAFLGAEALRSAPCNRGWRWCGSFVNPVSRVLADNKLEFLLLLVPLAAAAVLVLRPRLAARLVPVALIVIGLDGYIVVRDQFAGTYGFTTVTWGGYTVGTQGFEMDLLLPQAVAFLLLGGWLAWRSQDRVLARTRTWLLARSSQGQDGQLRVVLLLPVVLLAAELCTPNLLLGHGLGLLWTPLVIAGSVAVTRRWPAVAARVATAGLLCLGSAGVWIARFWNPGPIALPESNRGVVMFGAVQVASPHAVYVATVQALAFLALGAWLLPRTFPEARRLLGMAPDAELVRRVQRLTESRSLAVDSAAADLRRLERDLHDGAQARLVALGMNLRVVERLIPTSPAAAVALVAEARETSARALIELRELVRGVHPPVLADRGLGDAIRALALDTPVKVEMDIDLPGRLAAPVETACYFAVAEVLTNIVKHSGARDARIDATHADGMLRIAVTDFGVGGAEPARGTGLAGVEKRLATFDGIVAVSSPVGGPTTVVMEVPCALSSQRISSC